MRSEARASSPRPIQIDPVNPFQPRSPHFPAKAKSVIFLFMSGGPSQVDTFDYKPLLQKLDGQEVPASFKDPVLKTRYSHVFHNCTDLMASPFKFAQHGKSGMWVSELFPHLAERVDDLCFIHSMQADSNNHAPATYQIHTGETIAGKASLGSWVTYGLGSVNQNLPGYVALFDVGPYGGMQNFSNGYLPAAFQGTRLRSEGVPVLDLKPSLNFARGQRDSLDLIKELNLEHRDEHPGVSDLDARIASYELAYRMQSATLEVGDLDKEPAGILNQYGVTSTDPLMSKFARKCLLARRLVERGVRFVHLCNTFDKMGWDSHEKLPQQHPILARQTDQPVAALIADLKVRNLLDETLVIWAGEFGRTPMMQGGDHGRQHNSAGFTIWMAGGGVKPGTRLGSTDELGLMAVNQPHGIRDLHATILAALGLHHEDLAFEVNGRAERLTGLAGQGEVISGVLDRPILTRATSSPVGRQTT